VTAITARLVGALHIVGVTNAVSAAN